MILTAHQPVYLPWLGLFHKIALADRYVCYDHVALSSYDYTARNQIQSTNGPVDLIVPLKKPKGEALLLKDVRIDSSLPWRRKHWRTIESSYRKTPFFNDYAPFFDDFYRRDWQFITEMNTFQLTWFLDVLGIPRRIEFSSELGIAEAKADGVLDMCRKLNADVFIFGALGRDYANPQRFKSMGVTTIFQDYRHPVYAQAHGAFVSHLSIVDLLFNHGPQSLSILMSGNATRADLDAAA